MIHQVPEIIELYLEETKEGTKVLARFARLYQRFHTYEITAYKERGAKVELFLKRRLKKNGRNK